MVENAPCLVYLILNSRSLGEMADKQNWFDLWNLMDNKQKNQLYSILYRETYKLAAIDFKYKHKQKEIEEKYSDSKDNEDNDPEKLNILAYEYARSGLENWRDALSTINKAIELNPKEANYYDSRGEILLMMGDQKNALKMWQKVMELDPDFLQKHDGSTPFYQKLKENGLLK